VQRPTFDVDFDVDVLTLKLILTLYAGFIPAYPMKGAKRLSSKKDLKDFKDFDFRKARCAFRKKRRYHGLPYRPPGR